MLAGRGLRNRRMREARAQLFVTMIDQRRSQSEASCAAFPLLARPQHRVTKTSASSPVSSPTPTLSAPLHD